MATVWGGFRRLARWRTIGVAVLLLLAAVLVWTTLTAHGRITAKSLLFLPNLIPDFPVRPINWVTRTPDRIAVTFSDGIETWSGDLYVPATSPPHPGIIVALGVTPAGRQDKRVERLGDGLARMGVVTLIPYSQSLIEKRVTPRDIDFLVEAYRFLAARPEVDPGRVGYLGVCVGSSLSLLAAQDPRIAGRVSFVNWFGGYYRLDELIASVVSRSYQRDGEVVAWTPDKLTEEVVQLRLIDLVDEPRERDLLHRDAIEGQPLTPEETAGLSSTASVVRRLLRAESLDQARALIAQLPPEARQLLDTLSPATNLGRSRVRIFLMDDTSDRLIPYVHTRELAADLDGRYERHSRFSIFSHVNLDRLANPVRTVPELWSLFLHVRQIFQTIR
ncbi:MAG: hypothetical protein V3V35_00950 [Dehalococcoidia bacterium]